MDRLEAVQNLIFQVLDELNRSSPASAQVAKSPGTILLGPDASLDSLGFVNLLVLLEQKVESDLGAQVTLMDDQALSEANSPFRTVASLAQRVGTLVDAAKKGSGEAGSGKKGSGK
jgi:acyl carrier protein